MQVYKYKAVSDNDIHPLFKDKGISGIVGHHLNRIAQDDSEVGSLAEGILRSGDANLLPILNDKLAGDDYTVTHPYHTQYDTEGNMVSGPLDWHHAPRAIAIDKIVHGILSSGTVPFAGTHVQVAPIEPSWAINNWLAGNRSMPSQRHLYNKVKEVVPDVKRMDLYHSLARLTIPQKGASTHTKGHEDTLNKTVDNLNNNTFSKDTLVKDPHKYTDTRPSGKRNVFLYKKQKSKKWLGEKIKLLMGEGYGQKQSIAIALSMAGRSKYSVTKAGSKGMVDQVSPLAAFGVWRKPGEFSTSLEYEPAKNKKLAVDEFKTAKSKPDAPANPFAAKEKQRKLSIEFIRKLALHFKKFRASKKT